MADLVKASKGDIWARRSDETEEEYLQFMEWLSGDRPSLKGQLARVSINNEWAERANAYDVADALAQNPQQKFNATINALNGVAMLEASKLLRQSARAGDEPILSPKETIGLLKAMGGLIMEAEARQQERDAAERAEKQKDATGTAVDVDNLSDDEFDKYRQVVEILEKRKQ